MAPGLFVVTSADVGSLPAGCQVITRHVVEACGDPLWEVEYRGRRAWCHESELEPLGKEQMS